MRHRRRHISMRGFSLLEVLVAFAVVALALGVLLQIYARGSRAAVLGEEYAQAILIAESKLAELSIPEHLVQVETNGREHDKYDWQLQIDDYEEEAGATYTPEWRLLRVAITVTWRSTGKHRRLHLQTLKPAPAT